MTDRTLVNAATKVLGLMLVTAATHTALWALFARFVSSDYPEFGEPMELMNWCRAIVFLLIGCFLVVRSAWLTELMFKWDRRFDEPVEPEGPASEELPVD